MLWSILGIYLFHQKRLEEISLLQDALPKIRKGKKTTPRSEEQQENENELPKRFSSSHRRGNISQWNWIFESWKPQINSKLSPRDHSFSLSWTKTSGGSYEYADDCLRYRSCPFFIGGLCLTVPLSSFRYGFCKKLLLPERLMLRTQSETGISNSRKSSNTRKIHGYCEDSTDSTLTIHLDIYMYPFISTCLKTSL